MSGINGSILTSRSKYPWFCNVINSGADMLAGGVYLGGKYVLTSAQRLLSANDNRFLYTLALTTPSNITVNMEQLNLSDHSLFPQYYTVEEIIPHPDFKYNYVEFRDQSDVFQALYTVFSNDLAILKLNSIPDVDGAVLIPTDIVANLLATDTNITAVGTGYSKLVHPLFLTDTVSSVPVELYLSDQEVIYVSDSNYIHEVALNIKNSGQSYWDQRTKTLASVFKLQTDVVSGYPAIPAYKVDKTKNTNLDSSDQINTHVYVFLNSDWSLYWSAHLQLNYGYSSDVAVSIIDSIRTSYAPTVLESDLSYTEHKFLAANNGTDLDSCAGLALGDQGGPAIYRHTDGVDYLLGIYNTGPSPDIYSELNWVQPYYPSVFTNVNDYRSWIIETITDLPPSDQEYHVAESMINTFQTDISLWTGYVSDVFTTDTVTLWSQSVTGLVTDTSELSNELNYWSTDLSTLQTILEIYSSDGSSDFALTSDLQSNLVTYTTDLSIITTSLISLTSDFSTDGVATEQIPIFSSDLQLFSQTVNSFSTDVDYLNSSLGTFNNHLIDTVTTNSPSTYRDTFYRLRVSNPLILFDTHSYYSPYANEGNDNFFKVTITGTDASVLHGTDYYSLIVVNTGDTVIRESKSYIPSQLGKSKQVLLGGVLLPGSNGLADIDSKIGLFDDHNGHYVGLDHTGIYVAERSYDSELKIHQSGWNIDKMDGTGQSGIDFTAYPVVTGGIPALVNLSYSHLFIIIDIQWSGIVKIGFFINGIPRYVHQFSHEHYKRPYGPLNLPIRYQIAKVSNTAGVTNEMRMSWTCVMIEGDFTPHLAAFSYTNAKAAESILTPATVDHDTELVPIFSFKVNSNYSHAIAKIVKMQFYVSSQNDIYWELVKNATLQSDTWVETVPHGSMLQIDNTASRYAHGTIIKSGFASRGLIIEEETIKEMSDYLREPSINGLLETVTLGVKNLNGSSQVNIWFIINWVEL